MSDILEYLGYRAWVAYMAFCLLVWPEKTLEIIEEAISEELRERNKQD